MRCIRSGGNWYACIGVMCCCRFSAVNAMIIDCKCSSFIWASVLLYLLIARQTVYNSFHGVLDNIQPCFGTPPTIYYYFEG